MELEKQQEAFGGDRWHGTALVVALCVKGRSFLCETKHLPNYPMFPGI